jgi:ABC-type glycerol-3-phosphate transport system substrate-binding protein
MGHLLSPDWKEADAVLLNWLSSPSDSLLDHTLIVTESSSRGRFVSSETSARNNVPWNEYFTKIVPEFFEKDNHEAEYPYHWTWDLIRPTFKASTRE